MIVSKVSGRESNFWLYSLSRLNATRDFQAFGSANRALLEITVDLALLHQDKSNSSGWKMWWWNLSEKLKGAEQIINFFSEKNVAVPSLYTEQQNFIDKEKPMILRMRNSLWNGKHPNRWSGRSNFFDDLVEADKFLGNSVTKILNVSLTEYYRTRFRKMSWLCSFRSFSILGFTKRGVPYN